MKISILYLTSLLLNFPGNTNYTYLKKELLSKNSFIEIDTSKIRFDGIYNTYDTSTLPCGEKSNEHYKTNKFIVFFKNGKSYLNNGYTIDSIAFQKKFYLKTELELLGEFNIKNDTIQAMLPTLFFKRGMCVFLVNANYQGLIKNRDTIINWKMVPPFPHKVKPYYNNYFKEEIRPKTLYFIKNDAIRKLDSLVYK